METGYLCKLQFLEGNPSIFCWNKMTSSVLNLQRLLGDHKNNTCKNLVTDGRIWRPVIVSTLTTVLKNSITFTFYVHLNLLPLSLLLVCLLTVLGRTMWVDNSNCLCGQCWGERRVATPCSRVGWLEGEAEKTASRTVGVSCSNLFYKSKFHTNSIEIYFYR